MSTNGRHSIIPAVWVIVKNDQNQIYLLRRHNTGWRDGWYTVPAGHVEKLESPKAAAVRELREEVGVVTTAEKLGEPLIYFYPDDERLHERVSLFFTLDNYDGPIENLEPHKADEGRWFDMDDLPDTIVPLLRRALKDISSGLHYSEIFYDEEYYTKELL